jgi:hypothetical protein
MCTSMWPCGVDRCTIEERAHAIVHEQRSELMCAEHAAHRSKPVAKPIEVLMQATVLWRSSIHGSLGFDWWMGARPHGICQGPYQLNQEIKLWWPYSVAKVQALAGECLVDCLWNMQQKPADCTSWWPPARICSSQGPTTKLKNLDMVASDLYSTPGLRPSGTPRLGYYTPGMYPQNWHLAQRQARIYTTHDAAKIHSSTPRRPPHMNTGQGGTQVPP